MRRRSRRVGGTLAVVAFLVLAPAASTTRSSGPPPWAGGAAVETPFEQYAGRLASVVAGRRVHVICNDASDWGALATQQRLDPITVWGFVLFTFDASTQSYRPDDSMQLAEAPCRYLDRYWRAPASEKGKTCPVTGPIVVQGRAKLAPRVMLHVCPDYDDRVFALQTISHESQHLAGTEDEATAECNGMQGLAWFAQQFGATVEQSVQMAGDYYRDVYLAKRRGTPYYSDGCPDPSGGSR